MGILLLAVAVSGCGDEESATDRLGARKGGEPGAEVEPAEPLASEQLVAHFPLFPMVERRRWQALREAEALATEAGSAERVREEARQRAERIASELRRAYPFQRTEELVSLGKIRYEPSSRRFSIPARICYPLEGDERHPGELELVLCSKIGRTHETLFETDARPLHLELLMLLAGFEKHAQGSRFSLSFSAKDGREIPVETLIRSADGEPLPTRLSWQFTGSDFKDLYSPDQTGDFVICWHAHDAVLRVTDEQIASGELKLKAKRHPDFADGEEVTVMLTPIPSGNGGRASGGLEE